MKSRDGGCIALDLSVSLIRKLTSDVPTSVFDALEKGDPKPYISLDSVPTTTEFSRWDTFFESYVVRSILSKADFLPLGIDRAAVAIDKFLSAESSCRDANRRIASFDTGQFSKSPVLSYVLTTAAVKIERLLGSFDLDSLLGRCSFGPGASVGFPRKHGDAFYKFGGKPTVTMGCAGLAQAYIRSCPAWFSMLSDRFGSDPVDWFNLVPGNRITTVPKNAKTDRVIAIEPLMNMFFQKGIGGMIRRKLKSVKIDLDDQSRNQVLALNASRDGHLATIDLSAASDTICGRLVDLLLPPDWLQVMKLTRSPLGVLASGDEIIYQKWSSMGNGYTFELESLIFWALCSGVLSYLKLPVTDLAVYGDDIVVPVDAKDLLFEILDWCGFTPNPSKSFSSGPFRESCGKHYFGGRDVTPLYVKEPIQTLDRKIWFANSIRSLAFRLAGSSWSMDGRLREVYERVVLSLPEGMRKPRFPNGGGDTALQGDFDEVTPRRAGNGWDGWSCWPLFSLKSPSKRVGEIPTLLKWFHLAELGSSGVLASSIPCGQPRRVRPRRPVIFTRWDDYGPWN